VVGLVAIVSADTSRLLLAYTIWRYETLPNKRCSRQALFGCGFAAMVVLCLQLN
jgi:hypothetical protein